MNDDADITQVREVLIAAGLQVDRVPEGATRTCDLRASDGAARYVIEVKSLQDDQAIGSTLARGDVHIGKRDWFNNPTLHNAIHDAARQLSNCVRDTDDLRITALIPRVCFGADVAMKQAVGVLCGIGIVLPLGGPRSGKSFQCLYFGESVFFRHRHDRDGLSRMDAAIVLSDDGDMLLINDHSSHRESMQSSRLAQFFMKVGALNNAAILVQQGGFLHADCDIDRSDEPAVLRYLEGKYGFQRLIRVNPTEHSAMVSVRRGETAS